MGRINNLEKDFIVSAYIDSLCAFNNALQDLRKAESTVALLAKFREAHEARVAELGSMGEWHLAHQIEESRCSLDYARNNAFRAARDFVERAEKAEPLGIVSDFDLLATAREMVDAVLSKLAQ